MEIKLKIIVGFQTPNEQTIMDVEKKYHLTTKITVVADREKYKHVANLGVLHTFTFLETRERIVLEMEKSFLILIPDQQAKGDNVNYTLISWKAK